MIHERNAGILGIALCGAAPGPRAWKRGDEFTDVAEDVTCELCRQWVAASLSALNAPSVVDRPTVEGTSYVW